MRHRFLSSTIAALALVTLLTPLQSQSQTASGQNVAPTVLRDGWERAITVDQKAAPVPPRDLSGTWQPARGPLDGVGPKGARDMIADGKHEPPYTPLGLQMLSRTKPGNGNREVVPAEINDPMLFCNPLGMPRADLGEFRITQIIQFPSKILVLYQFNRIWRVIWTDGRDFPKDPEPRWYGYSSGKWVDDYTFVVQTIGADERTWIDKAGRPHSKDMRVEERFHRVDHDHLELTVTIDDPKIYTKPWVALDKLPMKLLPEDFDVREMICAPSETADYEKTIGSHAK